MKFNSYFARLARSEEGFSGNLLIGQESIPAQFRKIGADLFIVFFPSQVELRHRQEIPFRSGQTSLRVLLPVLGKYNQRKLKKLAELFSAGGPAGFEEAAVQLLKIDKFLEADKLLDFFSRDKAEAIPALLRLEIDQKIKIITPQHLLVTSYANCEEALAELKGLVAQSYESRIRSIRLVDLEKKLKVPHSTIFFKYLLRSLPDDLPFKVVSETLILQKLPLSESEKGLIAQIEKGLKKNKLAVFTFEDAVKFSGLNSGQVNDSLWYMQNEERIVSVSERYFIFAEELSKIINRLRKYKRNQGEMIDFNSFREMTSLSRKYLIVLFEYLDAKQFTQRLGNQRKILVSA